MIVNSFGSKTWDYNPWFPKLLMREIEGKISLICGPHISME